MAYEEKKRWGTVTLKAKREASYSKALLYKINGSPLNLTNYTATFTITVNGKLAITLTSGHGLTLGGSAGTIVIFLTKGQMSSLPVGRHEHYLEITNQAGNEDTPIFDGTFIVE